VDFFNIDINVPGGENIYPHPVQFRIPMFDLTQYFISGNIIIKILCSNSLRIIMKAVVYEKPMDVKVQDVPKPRIEHPQDVILRIRREAMTPIVILSGRYAEREKVEALERGADDYVTKPFGLAELHARIRVALRRAAGPAGDTGGRVVAGPLLFDAARHEVRVRDERVALPLKEFELLELLLANAGRVLTRDVLIDRVWGPNYFGDTKTLDVHIKRLRAKIEDDPAHPTRSVTVRGVGYRYEKS
jgi:two-component system response regulator RegX3